MKETEYDAVVPVPSHAGRCGAHLWLRPWAWGLSLTYAGFGIMSEAMNQLAFGFHPVRSGFMATTALFMLYLLWRRHLFTDPPPMTTTGPSLPEGSH